MADTSLISVVFTFFCVIIIIVIVLSVALRVLAYLTRSSQDSFLYYPSIPEGSNVACDNPCKMGLLNAEEVQIRSSDNVVLRGFMMWPTVTSEHGSRNANAPSKAAPSSAGSSALSTSPSPSTSAVISISTVSPTVDHVKDSEYRVTISGTCTSKNKPSLTNNCLTECRGNNTLIISSSNSAANDSNSHNSNNGGASLYFNNSSSSVSCRSANDRDDAVLCSSAGMLVTGEDAAAKSVVTDSTTSSPIAATPTCVLLYFHGNAGNVGHRIELASYFVQNLHCAVMMMDYRGYGLSTRVSPTQDGLENDAQACLDHLYMDRRVPHDRIFVMGSSLGGAVTIHLSANCRNINRIRGVILENTFTSLSDMTSVFGKQVIQNIFGNSSRSVRWVNFLFEYYLKPIALMLRWNSAEMVHNVQCPILFLSGLQDEIVPSEQMHRLYMISLKRSRRRIFATFPHGQHNNLMTQPKYIESINSFITEVLHSSNSHEE